MVRSSCRVSPTRSAWRRSPSRSPTRDGRGRSQRSSSSTRARRAQARGAQLAAIGFASLAYDKRGCVESGGDWREVGLDQLAKDPLPALELMAGDPRIDSKRIGLMGLSQGAWVSLIAAEQSEHVRFVV